ncbi:unnamed protein product, partial [Brassica oleracea]
KLKYQENSDGNYLSDPRFYNEETLLLPHFSLLPLRLISGSSPSSPAISPFSPDDISGESSLNLHKSCPMM